MSELKPCPFCGSIPEFGPIYDPDERRHMDMDLECCVTMTARISYPEYTVMNSFALKDALQTELIKEWNRRTQPEAPKPAQDLSAAILAIKLPAPFFAGGEDAGFYFPPSFSEDQMRALLKAAAALASPSDALVAGDRVDAERTGTLYQAVQRAAGELPEGWTICLEIERDAGTVELIDPEGNRKLIDGNDGYLCQAVNEATNAAIQAQKDGHG